MIQKTLWNALFWNASIVYIDKDVLEVFKTYALSVWKMVIDPSKKFPNFLMSCSGETYERHMFDHYKEPNSCAIIMS